jgi:hypothetical protein
MRITTLSELLGTPHFHAVCLVLVSVAAIEALVALWAATSRVHWFWRAIAVWAAITVLLPIRAYQPALLLAVTSPLTIVLIRAISRRRGVIRFGLLDLFFATALIGMALASLLHLAPRLGEVHFAEFTLTAIALTAIPTLVWSAQATTRPRTCYAALLSVIAGVSLAVHFIKPGVFYDWALAGVLIEGGSWRFHDVQVVATATGELALILLVAIPGFPSHRKSVAGEASPMRAARRPPLLLASCWLVCLALIYGNMLRLRPLPPPFSNQTNHYRRLIDICQQMRTIEKAGFPQISEPQRQALIAEAIPLLESASFVPYDLPQDCGTFEGWNKAYNEPAQHVRTLARAIDAEAAAAISRGDKDRACDLTLSNIRLGLMLQRGGTVVEYLIGVAVQSIANQRLIAIRGDLSPKKSRRVIEAWNQALAEAESVEAIIGRDAAMSERAYGWAARLANIVDWAGLPQVYFAIDEAELRRQATARLLQADLAIRFYKQHSGRLPAKLDELVPAYLPALPLDPYSGQPLVYRTSGDDFTLYSVGHDRTDNGGKCANMRTYYSRDVWDNLISGYDFDLDTQTRP